MFRAAEEDWEVKEEGEVEKKATDPEIGSGHNNFRDESDSEILDYDSKEGVAVKNNDKLQSKVLTPTNEVAGTGDSNKGHLGEVDTPGVTGVVKGSSNIVLSDNDIDKVDSLSDHGNQGSFIKWKTRGPTESSSTSNSELFHAKNANDSNTSTQTNRSLPKRSKILMTKLEKKKVSSKRGRPKKKKVKSMVNKYFEIPERYKLPFGRRQRTVR